MEIIKKSNGKESPSLLIFIYTNKTAVDCQEEVVQWFLKCLTPLCEKIRQKYSDCDFNIISNVQNNNYEEEDKTISNKIVIALQNGGVLNGFYSKVDEEDIIILDEKPKHYNLKGNYILNLLKNEPYCITKLGVSSVSIDCMKDYWTDMVIKKPSYFDISGKGYMVHPMWMYFKDIEWGCIRERSCNFGW